MTPNTKNSSVLLSVMMFLQYAVWGIWLPYLASYLSGSVEAGGLGFTGSQVGWILGLAGSIGAVSAPFLAGQIADRFIDASKYLGLLLILGGIAKFATYYARDYDSFLVMSIVFSVLYMPTLALTNSITFAHLTDPEGSFPRVRVWGTIGWIVASTVFPLIWLQSDIHLTWMPWFFDGTPKPDSTALIADCLCASGIISVLYGIWAVFFLPRTPPTRRVEHPFAFMLAFKAFAHPAAVVLLIAALVISMIHQVYFIRMSPFLESLGLAQAKIGPTMAIGQVAEIIVLAWLGFLIRRFGFRWTIILGCLAFTLRFACFALAPSLGMTLAIIGIALHGFCYACFFAVAYIFVERIVTHDIRHSAQTAFGIVILGIGPILAGFYNEWLDVVGAADSPDGLFNWPDVWWVQAAAGGAAVLLCLLAFRPHSLLASTPCPPEQPV